MHDVRGGSVTGEEDPNEIEEAEQEKKRKSRADRKWQHDLYNDRMQMPKSSKEINRQNKQVLEKTTREKSPSNERTESSFKKSENAQKNMRNETKSRNMEGANQERRNPNKEFESRNNSNQKYRFKTRYEKNPGERGRFDNQYKRLEKSADNCNEQKNNRFEQQQKVLESARRPILQRRYNSDSEGGIF